MSFSFNGRGIVALLCLGLFFITGCQVTQPDALSAANHPANPLAPATSFRVPTLFMHPAPVDSMRLDEDHESHEDHSGHEGHGGHGGH